MIDSISWQLNKEQFKLKKINAFDSVATKQITGFAGTTLFCKTYKSELKKQGIYFPMLEITSEKRGFQTNPDLLNIQISLGKVLYGSNAFEPDENDLETIYKKSIVLLDSAGVGTSEGELKQTIIRKADFSKVIIMPVYLGEANQTVLKLFSFNYKPRSVFDYFQYEEGRGALIRFGNSTQKYSAYDKIGEIFAKGYTKTENTIIKAVNLGEASRSAIKFELAYTRKDSFEKAMRARIQHKKKDYFLEDILKKELSKDILLKAFDSVFESVAVGLVSLSEMEENKLWAYLENSKLTQNRKHFLFYWVRMATKNGIGGTWAELKKKYKGGSVAKNKKEIALALQELGTINGNVPNLIDFLRAEHEKFEIIKPKAKYEL